MVLRAPLTFQGDSHKRARS